jgi:hypothetical protein
MNSIISNLYKYLPKIIRREFIELPKLELSNLKQTQLIYNNNDPKSYCRVEFSDKSNDKYVGVIVYRLASGEISNFHIMDEYRYQGLGKQIITQTINHMKEYNTPYIWVGSNKRLDKLHYFWSNVVIDRKNFKWCDGDENKLFNTSLNGTGYQMKIKY